MIKGGHDVAHAESSEFDLGSRSSVHLIGDSRLARPTITTAFALKGDAVQAAFTVVRTSLHSSAKPVSRRM
jgi:hypothetical protein